MSTGCALPPNEHAAFAVVSRLLSCLVTESLLRAFYLPINSDRASGALVVLSTHIMSEHPIIDRALRHSDIFAIIPLHHPPVLKGTPNDKHGQPVGLVDPLDMLPEVYELAETDADSPVNDGLRQAILARLTPPPWELGRFTTLAKTRGVVELWDKFVEGLLVDKKLRKTIENELSSSLHWQRQAFESPPSCPSLNAHPIKWEQSLVAGHPTHPMHRARSMTSVPSDYDWYHPKIRFVRVPQSMLSLSGPFEEYIPRLAQIAATNAGKQLLDVPETTLMPAHELQIPNLVEKFDGIEVLDDDIYVEALAQSSIRTVLVPDMPGIALKLAVGVKISSSLRTISHFTADFGPRFSKDIVPLLSIDRRILSIEVEPASAVYRGEPDIAKHFTAVLRQEYEPPAGENLIVCAALFEMGHKNVPPGVSAIEHVLNLNTEEKREAFLDRYIRLACEALVPPLLNNGVAFEAHAQNVLARFDTRSGELLGFVVRDLGGLRIHPGTLRQSTGTDFQFLPSHCVITDSLEETFPKFYHTLIHNHLQRLIRLLGMHHNGRGWEMLRTHLGSVIPEEHPLRDAWLGPENREVPGKCLMRMRLQGVYRDMVFSPFPNMIQYQPAIQS
ncbi:hypothetical protein HGRIS_003560 [Hohenbuehelia grisea]|uniref:IucC family-domain-containing protein n=1 Tax=Hohenbuehelia grisea TaxID=104357 RepID=A0ABR3JGM1_9AGAR